MAKYIEREGFINRLKCKRVESILGVVGIAWIKALLNRIPTIEIVKCKECQYWDKGENDCESWEYCKHFMATTYEDDYCSFGEQKREGVKH